MSYFYSPSTRGFYHKDVHVEMPDDVLALTDAEYQEKYAEVSAARHAEAMAEQVPLDALAGPLSAAEHNEIIYAELRLIDQKKIRALNDKFKGDSARWDQLEEHATALRAQLKMVL